MIKEDCQSRFLFVGLDRRQKDKTKRSKHNKRPLVGRKDIGKFAVLGIARSITIGT